MECETGFIGAALTKILCRHSYMYISVMREYYDTSLWYRKNSTIDGVVKITQEIIQSIIELR